ncbi:VAMP-associated protein [Xylona heveae TC161]|uniref:VAMP-associated protein n=1 Tax=Xylona heveae (strain CBS 132557 / TC161) TaxID=1328760 RepID=A0A165J3U2_XYLHT|nr:VAMP-associated protein [Xylona heveae TC161]KZF25692.1 VAMP-associated protein [Xylona heveae TC161]
MSIELHPPELGFRRPFTREVAQVLRLINNNPEPVAFKVKTTAPKQYCVRPNSGRIESGKEVEVQVLLQAMKEDPPADARCRDKFLVQSVAVSADQEFSNVAAIWAHVEKTSKSSIQERKIRVVFLPAESETPNGASGADAGASSPPAYRSVYSEQSPSSSNATAPVGPVSKPESRPEDSKDLGHIVNTANNPETFERASTSSGNADSQLADAHATISGLQRQLEESGLRQRKSTTTPQNFKQGSTASAGVQQQQAAASGVPVQIVAALCLISFLLAYFFF